MHWNLRNKLLAAFLSITAVFAVISLVTIFSLRQMGEHSQRFVAEHWPTADLLMETQIFFHELRATVLDPPADRDRASLVGELQQGVREHREEVRTLPLPAADLRDVDMLLAAIEDALVAPVQLFGVAGDRMEAADEAVQPVLARAIELGRIDLIMALWESVMAFNDYLITGDARERENFVEQSRWIEAHPAYGRLQSAYQPYRQQALAVFEAAASYQQARSAFLAAGAELTGKMQQLEGEYQSQVMKPAAAEVLALIGRMSGVLVGTVLGGLFLALIVALLLARRLGGVVGQVLQQAQQVRDGRLDTRLDLRRKDELGEMAAAMDAMAERLGTVVDRIGLTAAQLGSVAGHLTGTAGDIEGQSLAQSRQVQETSTSVRSILGTVAELGTGVEQFRGSVSETTVTILQMSASIEEVAQNTEYLAVAVEEVHASITEMTASIREIAASAGQLREAAEVNASSVGEMDAAIRQIEEHARQTAAIAEEVRTEAQGGQQAVTDTVAGIDDIGRAMQETAEVVRSLSEEIRNIDNIVAVIEEVTEQTDLLALNAAIIAAQAGEHGRGFAVVADEIRDLSERTSGSTREISRVVKGVQEGSLRVVATMDHARQRIAAGQDLSRHAGAALARIVAGVNSTSAQMEKIAQSTGEQTRGSRMLRDSMDRMARMTEQIASAVSQQSKGSEMILSAAGRMQEITSQVSHSTREQSRASQAVARTTEGLEGLFGRIQQISVIQRQEGEVIIGAVDAIEASAAAGRACAGELQQAVGQLAGEVEALEKEISYFDRSAPRPAATFSP
jgi:methyl-accepting chemotaxis protein